VRAQSQPRLTRNGRFAPLLPEPRARPAWRRSRLAELAEAYGHDDVAQVLDEWLENGPRDP
jgi:hypothetical protein